MPYNIQAPPYADPFSHIEVLLTTTSQFDAYETPKREIITFINDYLKIVEWYENTVDSQISSAVIRNDCKTRMNQLINYVKSN